ncbi:hypothetical protein L2E82_26953 [Cichorium intybus]|uniref:Uncharacterized protein n=1 Tax=Cichorium intybus TaxID=13427 RepID=A0ACB9CS11_CICIN|nr:hypothetical protein L2E82_26953 [Cichorium intybus]
MVAIKIKTTSEDEVFESDNEGIGTINEEVDTRKSGREEHANSSDFFEVPWGIKDDDNIDDVNSNPMDQKDLSPMLNDLDNPKNNKRGPSQLGLQSGPYASPHVGCSKIVQENTGCLIYTKDSGTNELEKPIKDLSSEEVGGSEQNHSFAKTSKSMPDVHIIPENSQAINESSLNSTSLEIRKTKQIGSEVGFNFEADDLLLRSKIEGEKEKIRQK